MNPIQIARGIEKTAVALVSELKLMSREVHMFLPSNLLKMLRPWDHIIYSHGKEKFIYQPPTYVIVQIEDYELADVAAVSAGNDYTVGNMIYNAICQVGKKGVVSIEKGKSIENTLQIVEGMQFNRGYLSPYFVTDRQKMIVEFQECKVITVVYK